jgi:hypothetical protein
MFSLIKNAVSMFRVQVHRPAGGGGGRQKRAPTAPLPVGLAVSYLSTVSLPTVIPAFGSRGHLADRLFQVAPLRPDARRE